MKRYKPLFLDEMTINKTYNQIIDMYQKGVSEEQIAKKLNITLNEVLLVLEQANIWEESVKWKYVIRNNKKIRKPYTDRENYKIVYDNDRPKEVKMSPEEIRRRSKSSKKAARKSKSKKSQTNIKRQRSLKKHNF